jgi:hypothetical protein
MNEPERCGRCGHDHNERGHGDYGEQGILNWYWRFCGCPVSVPPKGGEP